MKTIIILCALFLTACSSIPLATMIHFSDAKPADFFTVDPKGILVKVSINSVVNFDPTHSINLSASIKDSTGQRTIAFPLVVVSKTTQAAVKGLFNNSPAIDVYILKLSPKAIANLKVLHRERTSGIKKRLGLTAGVSFSRAHGNSVEIGENTLLSVALKLTVQDEFITLIDNWKVAISVAGT
ncbi:MAG: hypothetical protein HRT54_03160 [Colwellia sp.]|nr:hypothetical protein [Colwellia sp.]